MPFIDIKILKGHSEERKALMARGITQVIMDATGLPEEKVWITFQEIGPEDWFTGRESVKAKTKQSGE